MRRIFGNKFAPALQLLGQWHYQFDSKNYDYSKKDDYAPCYDPHDDECGHEVLPAKHAGGPGFQVWARTDSLFGSCSEVSIVFRGNTYSEVDNASIYRRSFSARHFYRSYYSNFDDSFRQLHRNINAIIRQITTTVDCYHRIPLTSPAIVSVGHSLGGGLAQFSALTNNPYGPQIEKVFTFNSINETGDDLVKKDVLQQNIVGLTIDRMYDTRDHLSSNSPGSGYPLPNDSCPHEHAGPLVRNIDVDIVSAWYPPHYHSIQPLAQGLVEASHDAQSSNPPPPVPSCGARYDKRSHQRGENIASIVNFLRSAFAPPRQEEANFGAQGQLYAPAQTQSAGPGTPQAVNSPPPAQAVGFVGLQGAGASPLTQNVAALGARQARSAPARTLLANLNLQQMQFGPVDTRGARATDSRGLGQFYALARAQSVHVDRAALPAFAHVPAANLGTRRAAQPEVAYREAR